MIMLESKFPTLTAMRERLDLWESSWTVRSLSILYIASYIFSVEHYLSVGTLEYTPRVVPIVYITVVLLFAVVPVLWLPTNIDRPSKGLYSFLYYALYIPSISIPFYLTKVEFSTLVIFNLVTLFTFFLINISFRVTPVYPEVKQFQLRSRTPALILLLASTFCILLIVKTFGIGRVFDIPALTEVYQVREMYKNQAIDPVLEIISLAMYIIFPSTVAVGLIRSAPFYVIVGILGEVTVYSVGGNRVAIALIIGIIGLSVVLSRLRELYAECLAGVFIIVALIPPVSRIFGTNLFESIFFERLVVTPGMISGLYLEFFLSHPKANEQILPYAYYFFEQNYPTSMANVIGDVYFYSSTHSNGSFIASGFGTFGFLGIIFSGVIVGTALYVYDSMALKSGVFGHLILVGPMLLFINTSIAIILDYGPVIAPIFVIFDDWPLISLFTFGDFIIAILIVYMFGCTTE